MRSPRRVKIERIQRLCSDESRYTDLGVRVRVYVRGPDGKPVPDRWLPWEFGGRYDRLVGCYVGPPESWVELKVHPGQVPLVESLFDPTARHVIALGSQGGGKTEGIVAVGILLSVHRSHRIIGGVAPTQKRLRTLRKKFLKALPRAWVREIRAAEDEVELVNGTVVQFVSTKRQSSATGSPFAGKDWHDAFGDEQQNMTDDDLQEVDARGRINPAFRFISSATNDPITEFQERLRDARDNPEKRVFRFTGPENVFTSLDIWEFYRRNWPAEDYRRKILCEDVPLEGRTWPQFSVQENVRPIPAGLVDVTELVCEALFRERYALVAATDFGSLTTATLLLRAFAPDRDLRRALDFAQGRRLWWAVGEVTTEDETTQAHGRRLLEHPFVAGDPRRFIVVGDPHEYVEVDKSDYSTLKRMGINARRASRQGETIDPKHRRSMMNSLFLSAAGERSLFVVPGACPRLVNALNMSMLGMNGKPERAKRRDRAHLGSDLTDHPDALSFGLYPFERIRGAGKRNATEDKPWASHSITRASGSRLTPSSTW